MRARAAPGPDVLLLRLVAIPVVAAVLLAGLALAVGVRTGYSTVDIDELVYLRTLRSMRDGADYYHAMRSALVAKDGLPPRTVRSVRPPTMFLFLRLFPERAWRYVAAIPMLAILLLAGRLGAPFGRLGSLGATLLAALWVLGASRRLFLEQELWGAPLFMAGLLAARRGRRIEAAGWIVGATLLRELFALGLVAGLLVDRRRLPWLGGLLAFGAAVAVHAALAASVVSPSGKDIPFGNLPRTPARALSALSPDPSAAGWVLGIPLVTAGAAGAARRWRADPAARLLLPVAAVLALAGVVGTRQYWALSWGPALSAFALATVRSRARAAPVQPP